MVPLRIFGTDRAYSFTKRIAKDLSKELSLLEEQQAVGERQMARIVKQNDRVAAILGSIPGVGLKTIAAFYSLCRGRRQVFSGKATLSILWSGSEGIPIRTERWYTKNNERGAGSLTGVSG